MIESQQTTAPAASTPAAGGLGATLLRAAWLAILLGFIMEALLLMFAAGFGILPGFKPIAADLVRQVSWSTFVCVGLALGTAVSQARAPLMGILGLLAAPLAFTLSRSIHQGGGQDPRNSRVRRWRSPCIGPRHSKSDRVRVPRSGYRLDRTASLGRSGGACSNWSRHGDSLRRHDRGPYVSDVPESPCCR